MHPYLVSSAVNLIPFATTLTCYASEEPRKILIESILRPIPQIFFLRPQILLFLIADRTLPSFEQGSPSCRDVSCPLNATKVPVCNTNACTLNPFVRFVFSFQPWKEDLARTFFF